VTISSEKKYLQREKEHCSILIRAVAHTLCGVYGYWVRAVGAKLRC